MAAIAQTSTPASTKVPSLTSRSGSGCVYADGSDRNSVHASAPLAAVAASPSGNDVAHATPASIG